MQLTELRRISKAARMFLAKKVGNQAVPGAPHLDEEKGTWRVAIRCSTPRGTLVVGQMTLSQAGDILSAPSREELIAVAKELQAKMPVLVLGDPEAIAQAGFQVVTDC